MSVYMCVCIYICTHTDAEMRAYIHIYIYMYIYMHVCMQIVRTRLVICISLLACRLMIWAAELRPQTPRRSACYPCDQALWAACLRLGGSGGPQNCRFL